MENIYLGKIVNTHGIKGEVRITSSFERKDAAFKINNSLIINNIPYKITSYRVHKDYDMVTFNGYNNINDVLNLVGLDVYINRDELHLHEDDFLYIDLIGYDVFLEENLGVIKDYISGVNPLLKVNYQNKNYYIPINGNFILGYDHEKKQVIVNESVKELMI